MIKTILTIFLFIFVGNVTVYAQQDSTQIVEGIKNYRDDLVERKRVWAAKMNALLDWPETNSLSPAKKDSIKNIIDELGTTLTTIPRAVAVKLYTSEKLRDTDWLEHYKDIQARLINVNYRLNFLAKSCYVSNQFPFEVLADSASVANINFLDVSSGDKILMPKVGKGTLGFLLSSIYDSLDITMVTSLRKDLKFLNHESKQLSSKKPGTSYSFKKGRKTLGINSEIFDKVIIFNGLHHFPKPHKMLESIMACMDNDSEMIIMESLKTNDEEGCEKRKTESQLKCMLDAHSLEAYEAFIIKDMWYVKCRTLVYSD